MRTEGTAAPATIPQEILFSDETAALPAQPLVNRSTRSARIEFDLAKCGFVIRHVLLQERHQRLRLLRTQINPLKIVELNLGFRALLHSAKDEEEIPHVNPDLPA